MIMICVALECELPDEFKKKYPDYWLRAASLMSGGFQRLVNRSFFVLVTGVGKKSAVVIEFAIRHLNLTEIVNFGTAGSSFFKRYQWVMLRSSTYNKQSINCHYQTSLPIPYHQFNLVDGVCVTEKDLHVVGEAIDMESFFLAETCQLASIPFVSIKCITDFNNHETDRDFNQSILLFRDLFMSFLSLLFITSYEISVVIPVYNRPRFVNRAIQSVANQSIPPKEIIVIDDGSTPPVKNDHSLIRLIRNEDNQGVSIARNLGISHATSDWIAFLDSDDIWATNHLDVLLTYIRHHTLCRWVQTDEDWNRNGEYVNKKAYHKKPLGWAFESSLKRCLVSPSAVMIHRSLFDWIGSFNPSFIACEDYDLWLRFLRYFPVGFANTKTMTKFAGHDGQLSMVTPVLDRFRVQSLINLYNHESNSEFKAMISKVLQHKLMVLIQGAKKRSLFSDYADYNNLIDQLNCQHHPLNDLN